MAELSRADCRAGGDFREVHLERGLCLTAQGSSRLQFGATEVIATLSGPKECRVREIDTGRAQVRVKTFPEMHELSDIIATSVRGSLDCGQYPDSTVDIAITLVRDDGALACCAVNAAMAALSDAGLRLWREVAASCIAVRGHELLADPSKQEEDTADGVATFVYAAADGEVFGCFFEGMIEPEMIDAALARAVCGPQLPGSAAGPVEIN
jgi:ribonuclease PH